MCSVCSDVFGKQYERPSRTSNLLSSLLSSTRNLYQNDMEALMWCEQRCCLSATVWKVWPCCKACRGNYETVALHWFWLCRFDGWLSHVEICSCWKPQREDGYTAGIKCYVMGLQFTSCCCLRLRLYVHSPKLSLNIQEMGTSKVSPRRKNSAVILLNVIYIFHTHSQSISCFSSVTLVQQHQVILPELLTDISE